MCRRAEKAGCRRSQAGHRYFTLSDEEARRRGTQKTVLERKAPPTFDVLIEIQDRQRMIVHHKVAEAVDSLLRGWTLSPEIRYVSSENEVHIESVENRERPGRIGQSRQGQDGSRRRQTGRRRDERAAALAETLDGGAWGPLGECAGCASIPEKGWPLP